MYSSEQFMNARTERKQGEAFSPKEEILISLLESSIRSNTRRNDVKKMIKEMCRIFGFPVGAIKREAVSRSNRPVDLATRTENSKLEMKIKTDQTVQKVKSFFK